jgi:phospholipase/carboxylesterase
LLLRRSSTASDQPDKILVITTANQEATSMQTNVTQPPVEISTAPAPQSSVIWLHGLGADGNDFVPIAQALHLEIPVRFIFPHAPIMPVTINSGYAMPAWYDIKTPEIHQQPDEAGIRRSQMAIDKLIQHERERGIPPENILLAGFSQGGAIALHTGLRYPEPLAGILALSTYLPLEKTIEHERSMANQNIPIMMTHGLWDDIIPITTAEHSKQLMMRMGYAVRWQTYPMPHTVCDDEIGHMRQFILSCLDK